MNFVFDLYGTLADIWTDEELPALWRGVCAPLGEDEDRYIEVKREYAESCAALKKDKYHEIDLNEVFESMITSRGLRITVKELALIFRSLSIVRLRLFPYVKEMLTALRKTGAGVYLVSNAQECFTRYELDTLGLTSCFDGIMLSSEEGVKKPSERIFHRAFKKFGISARDSYYIGNDMHDDILGAHGVGMKTVHIETEQSGKYCCNLPEPDYVAKDHGELKDLLLSLAMG